MTTPSIFWWAAAGVSLQQVSVLVVVTAPLEVVVTALLARWNLQLRRLLT